MMTMMYRVVSYSAWLNPLESSAPVADLNSGCGARFSALFLLFSCDMSCGSGNISAFTPALVLQSHLQSPLRVPATGIWHSPIRSLSAIEFF